MADEATSKSDWESVWKEKGASYDQMLQQVDSRAITALINPYFSKNDKVLEAGCGDGKFVFYFNSKGYNLTGLDYADSTIERNKAIAKQEGLDEDGFRVGNIKDLSDCENQFDVYLSMGVIEHFKKNDQQAIIKNAYLCLKKGGKVVITVPNLISPWTITRYITTLRYPNKRYQKNISRFKIKRMFEKQGFQTIRVFNAEVRPAFRMAFQLENKRPSGFPNPFYCIRGVLYRLADFLEKRLPIIGYNTFYIGQKK